MDARQIYADVSEKNRQLVRKYRELGRKASLIQWMPFEERAVARTSLAAEEGTTAHEVELAGHAHAGLASLELDFLTTLANRHAFPLTERFLYLVSRVSDREEQTSLIYDLVEKRWCDEDLRLASLNARDRSKKKEERYLKKLDWLERLKALNQNPPSEPVGRQGRMGRFSSRDSSKQ